MKKYRFLAVNSKVVQRLQNYVVLRTVQLTADLFTLKGPRSQLQITLHAIDHMRVAYQKPLIKSQSFFGTLNEKSPTSHLIF